MTKYMPKKYLIGHEQIDTQHEVLFALYTEINNVINGNTDSADVNFILGGLINYVGTHFKFEEELMRSSDYPQQQAHVAEHRELESRVMAFKKRYDSTKGGNDHRILSEMQKFLHTWLGGHIGMTDRDLSRHIKEKHAKFTSK